MFRKMFKKISNFMEGQKEKEQCNKNSKAIIELAKVLEPNKFKK